jgi:dienelactone hydrolase
MKKLVLLVGLLLGLCTLALGADRNALFAVPDFNALPPAIETISETTQNGVILTELYFAGAPFNGQPTRIYGFYARPAAPGKYPGVVQLHGAGLVTLTSAAALLYAQHGYACLSIDWAGPGPNRVGKTSELSSPGWMASPALLPDGTPDKTKPWVLVPPEVSGITNGVRFVLRAFMFLRSRPEVDANKLCLSGMSAGAHLSLLVLGQDPTIKAATVKYGEAFIRDVFSSFDGYFGPIAMTSKADQDAWLAVLDPKYDVPNYKASVLLVSGTDDIFFWMPIVLKTYREIPTPKRLLMLPNDNHSQVGNEEIPMRWFGAVLGTAPAFPQATAPTAQVNGEDLQLTSQVTGPSKLTSVQFIVKTMPLKTFWAGSKDPPWSLVPTTQDGDNWTATVPAPAAGEQLVAYVLVQDETGARVSSDTVEAPDYPQWRGLPASATTASVPGPAGPMLADGNLFLDPSFEEQKQGTVGQLYLNFVGQPTWDGSGAQAHTGKWAVAVTGGDQNYLACGAPAEAGKTYRLSGYFKAEHDGVRVRLQINWGKAGGGLVKYELSTPVITTDYQKYEIVATAPPETASALLIISGGSGVDDKVWMDDLYYGEVK